MFQSTSSRNTQSQNYKKNRDSDQEEERLSQPQKIFNTGFDGPAPIDFVSPVAQYKDAERKKGLQMKKDEDKIKGKPNQTGLPDNLKTGVESLSGQSMDDVKVHYNSDKPAQLGALAYAQGSQIHVAPGQEQHLPHEAWHIAQQKQGRVKPTKQMKDRVNVNDDKELEREADEMGYESENSSLALDSQKDPLQAFPVSKATGIGAAIGGFAGGLFGGPLGALAGGIVGAGIGAILEGNQENVQQSPYDIWYNNQIATYTSESNFPLNVKIMNYFFQRGREDVIRIIIDNAYTIRLFTNATDRWRNNDGSITETDLSTSLQGNTDRANNIIRLNQAISFDRLIITLYHELHHVVSAEPDYLEQEIQVRIQTENFAIDNGLPETVPGYRKTDNTVNETRIRESVMNSSHYNPVGRSRIGRFYSGETDIGPWSLM